VVAVVACGDPLEQPATTRATTPAVAATITLRFTPGS
jgi:hypothetical protein